MGRPLISGESIVVDIDGDLLVWTDGLISGENHELVKKAKQASKFELPTNLTVNGPTVDAFLDDPQQPLKALAALIAASPGRATILNIPDSIIDLLPFDDEDGIIDVYPNEEAE